MRIEKHETLTRGIKNCLDSRLLKGCSPLQFLCNLTGNRPQTATFHTADRYKQGPKTETTPQISL
ncbi:hypothetical protein DSECCO2_427510 [anaerobic digester metagenome]